MLQLALDFYLKNGDVEDLAGGEECVHEMFVDVHWSGRTLAVPLSQYGTRNTQHVFTSDGSL